MQIKQLALTMAEWQIGHQKSSLVLSTHFPVVKWCSHSAYWELLGRDDRWFHNARHMMSFVQKILIGSLRTGQNIWPYWFSSHQSRYYVAMAYRPVCEETCDVNIKIAQTTQNFWNFVFGKSGMLKKWQTSATIRETSYSNQETGRKLQCLYGIKIIGNTK